MVAILAILVFVVYLALFFPVDVKQEKKEEKSPKYTAQMKKLWQIAQTSMKERKPFRAEKALLTILKFDEKNAAAYNRLGILYAKGKKYDEAVECFEIAQSLDNNPASIHNAGLIYLETGAYEKAEMAFQQAIELEGDVPSRYIALAKAEEKMGNFKKSVEALENAYELDPSVATLRQILAIYETTGDAEAATATTARIEEQIARDNAAKKRRASRASKAAAKRGATRVAAVLLAVLMAVAAPAATVSAKLSEEQLYYYGQNGVYIYDPSGNSCGMSAGNNYNYNGDQVFTQSELEAIAANQPFYEEAANQYGFPWQILAVLHGRENSFKRANPENGQGAYQLYSYTRVAGTKELDTAKAFLPAGAISDAEFQRQTNIAAELVANSYGAGLDLTTDEGVKRMFFQYNGAASAYIDQALALGFSESEAQVGEGSPYVMNRFDEQRDPTVEPTASNNTWGQIKTDGGSMSYPANRGFGAFVMYAALGGSSAYCNSGELVSGGMTLEQAQEFMQYYIDKAKEYQGSTSNVNLDGATLKYFSTCGGALTNCVALSRWFLAKYTNAGDLGLPDGGQVVRYLVNIGFEDGGNTPRAYAIFSCNSCSTSGVGHTGVVLGVDETNNQIIIGEAGCGSSIDFIGAKAYALDKWMDEDHTYAYTDDKLIGL